MDSSDISQSTSHKKKHSYSSLTKITSSSSSRDPTQSSRRHLPSLRQHRDTDKHHRYTSSTSHKHHGHTSTRDKLSSAIELHAPISFSDLARSLNRKDDDRQAGSTPTESGTETGGAGGSRRGSFARGRAGTGGGRDEDLPASHSQPLLPSQLHHLQHHYRSIPPSSLLSNNTTANAYNQLPLIRPQAATKQHSLNQTRTSTLLTTLSSLTGTALRTTRQLDDIHYSILSHLANLRTTIHGLQDLSQLARSLATNFADDAAELSADIQTQLDAFGHFAGVDERIGAFERRVEDVRARARRVAERLELARRKVAESERLELEWQARASRRLRLAWGALGVLVGVVVVLLLVHYVRMRPLPLGAADGRLNRSSLSSLDLELSKISVPPPVKELLQSLHETPRVRRSGSRTLSAEKETRTADRDPRLRLFDEL